MLRTVQFLLVVLLTPLSALADVIPFSAASVTGTDNRHFTVSWTTVDTKTVSVYAHHDAAGKDRARKVGEGSAAGMLAVDLPPGERWYFTLVADQGAPLTIADRSLHLAFAPNFRDAGGYRTA